MILKSDELEFVEVLFVVLALVVDNLPVKLFREHGGVKALLNQMSILGFLLSLPQKSPIVGTRLVDVDGLAIIDSREPFIADRVHG